MFNPATIIEVMYQARGLGVMYMCIEVIDFVYVFFDFIVGFRSCSNRVNCIVFYCDYFISVVINTTIRLNLLYLCTILFLSVLKNECVDLERITI